MGMVSNGSGARGSRSKVVVLNGLVSQAGSAFQPFCLPGL